MQASGGGSPESPSKKLKTFTKGVVNCAVTITILLLANQHTVAMIAAWADPSREATYKSGPPLGHKRESEEYSFDDPDVLCLSRNPRAGRSTLRRAAAARGTELCC
jgi:hypothetical protein